MTKLSELGKKNPRQFFLTVGVCCAYGLLLGGLIVFNAQKPSAKDEAGTFDIAVIDFPAWNAKDTNKAAPANTASQFKNSIAKRRISQLKSSAT